MQLQHYANKYQLPARRNEVGQAFIAYLIARTMGGAEEAELVDYMPHRPIPAIDEVTASFDDMTPEQIRQHFGFEKSKTT